MAFRRAWAHLTSRSPKPLPDDVSGGPPPILVHGMSRTGGTLVATIFDAHPQVAMSYELYPWMLETDASSPSDLKRLAKQFRAAKTLRKATQSIEPDSLRTFFRRCARSGLDNQELGALLLAHAEAGEGFAKVEDRIRFTARCARAKMRAVGKERWGVKATARFGDYRAVYRDAYIVGVLRDGRDVLASQQNTGAFDRDPVAVARKWADNVIAFRELLDDPSARAYQVRYERLVADPEAEIRALAEFADLPFEPAMLAPHSANLTVFDAGHLSLDRITKPIDATQVGRWRRDVSAEDLVRFRAEAGEVLQAAGYGADDS